MLLPFYHFFNSKLKSDYFYQNKFVDIVKNQYKIKKIIEKNVTPIFIADNSLILIKLNQLKQALNKYWGKKNIIAYSYKTNYEVASEGFLKEQGVWAEIVSAKEYDLAKQNGYKKNIIYNGPIKNKDSLKKALLDGALINLDNFSDLNNFLKLRDLVTNKTNIGLRLNVFNSGHKASRFGFSINGKFSQADQALALLKDKDIELTAFHVHLGSDISKPNLYYQVAKQISNYINSRKINSLKYLDFGGGFPAHGKKPYGFLSWRVESSDSYVKAIVNGLNPLISKKNLKLILEPGRFLVDDAIIHVSKIVHISSTKNIQILTVDSAITMLPVVYYRPQIINLYDKNFTLSTKEKVKTKIFGATCKEDDLLFQGLCQKASEGDFLIYFCVGAYNSSMSSDFIFNKPKTSWLN